MFSARWLGDSQMHQAAQAASQTVADLAQRVRAPELAKQHGYELRPAGKAFGGTLGIVLLDECGELGAWEMLEQLIEQARNLYDCLALLVGSVWRGFWQEIARQRPIIGGHIPLISESSRWFWTRVNLSRIGEFIYAWLDAPRVFGPAMEPASQRGVRRPGRL